MQCRQLSSATLISLCTIHKAAVAIAPKHFRNIISGLFSEKLPCQSAHQAHCHQTPKVESIGRRRRPYRTRRRRQPPSRTSGHKGLCRERRRAACPSKAESPQHTGIGTMADTACRQTQEPQVAKLRFFKTDHKKRKILQRESLALLKVTDCCLSPTCSQPGT